jgi:hypothetical protein
VLYLFYEEGQRRHFVQQSQLPSRALGVCMEETQRHTHTHAHTHTHTHTQGDSTDRDRLDGYRDEEGGIRIVERRGSRCTRIIEKMNTCIFVKNM